MTNLATTQLGSESRPVMRAQTSPEQESFSRFNLSVNGQGVYVIPAVERSGLLGIRIIDVPCPGAFTQGSSGLLSACQFLPASPTAVLDTSIFLARVENELESFRHGTTGLIPRLGTVLENTDSAATSTFVTASGFIEGYACLTLGGSTLALTSYRSRPWISSIEEKFEFRGRDKVTSFLENNDFLISLVLEGHEKIMAEFGTNTRLILELVKDSESDHHDEELFLLVKTTLSVQEASKCLERLDERWWLRASRNAQCKLNIDFELA